MSFIVATNVVASKPSERRTLVSILTYNQKKEGEPSFLCCGAASISICGFVCYVCCGCPKNGDVIFREPVQMSSLRGKPLGFFENDTIHSIQEVPGGCPSSSNSPYRHTLHTALCNVWKFSATLKTTLIQQKLRPASRNMVRQCGSESNNNHPPFIMVYLSFSKSHLF